MSGDPLPHRNLESALGLGLVVEPIQRLPIQPVTDRSLDGVHLGLFGGRREGQGITDLARAGGAPDPVDVVLGLHRDIEVDDVRQSLHVDASSGDVGGDKNPDAPVLEIRQRFLTLWLAPIAVDSLALDPRPVQFLPETVGTVLGPREDQRGLDFTPIDHLLEQIGLEVFGHRHDGLTDAHGGLRLTLDVDPSRVVEEIATELDNGSRQGRGEEHGLALLGELGEDPADIREETHVEHPVALVENEEIEATEVSPRILHQVEQTPRRRNDDIDPGLQRALLFGGLDAAEDGCRFERGVARQHLDVFVDLRRELSGGSEDQHAGVPFPGIRHALEHGQDKGRGLTAARHGAGEDVTALEGRRNRVLLDRGGLGEAHISDPALDSGVEVHIGKFQNGSFLLRTHNHRSGSSATLHSGCVVGTRDLPGGCRPGRGGPAICRVAAESTGVVVKSRRDTLSYLVDSDKHRDGCPVPGSAEVSDGVHFSPLENGGTMKRSALLACVMLSVVVARCSNEVSVEPEPTPEETVLIAVGDIAPGFELTTLAGETFNLEAQRGKVVLINFFATWCPPCREELPYLEKQIWQAFDREKLAVVVIGRGENDEIIQPFVDKHGYTVPFAGDPDLVAYSQYATRFIPRNFVIGPDGTVLYQSQGYEAHEFTEMVELIAGAVAALEADQRESETEDSTAA